jgi:hypothetical protein
MGCSHADFTNNHATPQPEAGLQPKDFQALTEPAFPVLDVWMLGRGLY